MRTYAAVPHEYYEEMADLTDEEFGRLIRALLRYSMTGEESDLPGSERYFFKRVVNQEQRHQKHYEEVSAVRSEAGRRGAEARWGTNGKIANDGQNGNNKNNNKNNTKTNTNNKNNALSSGDEMRRQERMQKDILELGRFLAETQGAPGKAEGFSGESDAVQSFDVGPSGIVDRSPGVSEPCAFARGEGYGGCEEEVTRT